MRRSRLSRSGTHKHPKSRKEAMDIGAAFFFNGSPCKNGHVSTRYTSNGVCTACQQTQNNSVNYADDQSAAPKKLRDIDDALADKALERSLKEVWDE